MMTGIDGFQNPVDIKIDEETRTENYLRFTVEPLEAGYGHTLGNALRRVLLSSMQGVAVTAIRIDGVAHEFCSIPGIVEDVMEIVLNIKKLKFNCVGALPRTLELKADHAGAVTAADIREDSVVEVINKDQVICTLDSKKDFHMELDIDRGIGYRPSEQNKREDLPLGTIPVDSLFSPVERVRYDVQNCRVGQRTDYDSLVMELWTDKRIAPVEALTRAATILRDLFSVCILGNSQSGASAPIVLSDEDKALLEKLIQNVNDLNLPVRAVNCLNSANIQYLGQLVEKSENQMLKYRNFGRKSLDEIKQKLEELGLGLEMNLSESLKQELERVLATKPAANED